MLYVSGVAIKAYPSSNFFGAPLTAQWEIVLVLGITLGLLNYFLKPVLKALSLPLEILTLGLFTIVINMGLIWLLDSIFDELSVPFLMPLLYTTLIVWGINIVAGLIFNNKK
jgi:putative membrane protein